MPGVVLNMQKSKKVLVKLFKSIQKVLTRFCTMRAGNFRRFTIFYFSGQMRLVKFFFIKKSINNQNGCINYNLAMGQMCSFYTINIWNLNPQIKTREKRNLNLKFLWNQLRKEPSIC